VWSKHNHLSARFDGEAIAPGLEFATTLFFRFRQGRNWKVT
jgi:hypothetical protein